MTAVGRPTVLDPIKKEVIYALLAVGASQRRAAAVVAVSEATVRYALAHDPDFAQRVAQALALLEVELLVKLRQSAGRSWRACAFALQHLAPDQFANKASTDFRHESDIQRELQELEVAREREERAVAAGKPPEPQPAPDPNEPTTVASRQFNERFNQLVADCQIDQHEPLYREQVGQAKRPKTPAITNPHPPRRPDTRRVDPAAQYARPETQKTAANDALCATNE